MVLAACSVDGAGELVPIAYALAPIEDCDNWEWFVLLLKLAIPALDCAERPLVVLLDP